MAFKLLVALCLLQVVTINAQFYYPQNDPQVELLLKNLTLPAGMDNCDQTLCHLPCVGAAPPPRCPSNIPQCHTGCACHTDCNNGVVTCFETRHCLHGKRYFTARRRAVTKSKKH